MIFGFNQGFCYALSGKTIFRSNTHNVLKACALTWGYACVHNTICKALSVGHIFIQLHAIPVNYLSKSFLNLVFRSRAYPFFPPNDCAVPEKLGGGRNETHLFPVAITLGYTIIMQKTFGRWAISEFRLQ